jgi:Ca2+-binding RTX toxin-like protein
VQADATGKWSVQANITGSTVHSFTESAVDLAGNVGASPGVTLFAQSANTALKGGAGNDVVIGEPNDSLTGGAGSDTFVFNASFGKNVVTDFDLTADALAFSHSLGLTVQQILAVTHDAKGSAVISIDGTDNVTLTGVTTAQLNQHASDIHLF